MGVCGIRGFRIDPGSLVKDGCLRISGRFPVVLPEACVTFLLPQRAQRGRAGVRGDGINGCRRNPRKRRGMVGVCAFLRATG